MGSNPIQIANASVAQSVEQGTENPRVIGSIPIGGTKEYVVLSAEADEEAAYSFLADLAHLVERHLAKVEVASSSLVIRSRKFVVEIFTAFLLFTDNFPHSV